MSLDTEALLTALNTLVHSPDAKHLYLSLMALAQLKIVHTVELTGDAAVLNPLLRVYREDPEKFKRLVALVEEKRRQALLAPLDPPKEDKFDKVEYMREFMYHKRTRQRRAADIENSCRADKDRLVGRARLDFMDREAARWKAELDRRIEVARKAHEGRLPKDLLVTLRKQFWEHVDQELDARELATKLK